jgi:hypothetical protein
MSSKDKKGEKSIASRQESDKGKSPEPKPKLYDKGNDAVRVDSYCELDDAVAVALRSFFRKLGVPHLFDERVVPTLKSPDSTIFAAVRDRPWPPWGHGSRRIIAMMQAHSIGQRSYGLSPLYVRFDEVSNIGLRAALYKETLENLARQGQAEVNYLVIEGSVLTNRILSSVGFERGDDLVVTEESRYYFYRADAQALLKQLHLDEVSIPELLTHKANERIFDQNVLFQAVLEWGRFREIIPIDGGSFDAALPGGVPPTPPTQMPEIGPIDIILPGP